MRWMRTGALIIIAAGVLGALWYFEIAETGRTETQRLADGLLYPWDIEQVEGLELLFPDYGFDLARKEGTWRMVAPVDDLLDDEIITRILSTIDAQEVTRWLPPPTPAESDSMGFDAPRLEVRLRRGRAVDTLRIGDMNPVEQRVWVSVSWRDSVALVSSLLRTNTMQGYYELLDKSPVAGVPQNLVEAIAIRNARDEFSLSRIPGGWEILRPERYLADPGGVLRVLEGLWGHNIIDFVQDAVAEDPQFGFNRPTVTVTLRLRGDDRPRVFEVGAARHNLRFARFRDRDQVFIIPAKLAAQLEEPFSSYMSVVLLHFRPNRVVRIEDLEGRAMLRDMSKTWVWFDESDRKLAGIDVSSLVTRLARVSTERVAALLPREDQLRLWGLDAPSAGFALHFENRPELRIELGNVVEGRRYFRRPDYPTVYSLPAAELDFGWPRFDSEVESPAEE